jgi:hypothetical protein
LQLGDGAELDRPGGEGARAVASVVAGQVSGAVALTGKESGPSRPGSILALWIVLTLVLHAALWITGFEPKGLADAVDQGAARAEASGVGEVSDDLIRKAIKVQRASLPFWTTLARLGDFAVEPMLLAGRAITVATLFAAFAALTGRPIGFAAGLAGAAGVQGFWVLGLAVKVGLTIGLRRPDVETSLALLLPPGRYPAALVLLARQADPFLVLGWLALAWGGWRRHQVNLATALFLCVMLATGETAVRLACGLVTGAGMRLSVLPR